MIKDDRCTIRLVRPSRYQDRIRSYRILLNGKDAGKIANDSTLEIRAPSGSTTIEARIDWGRSRPLTINTAPGETVEIEVRNRWGIGMALWASTFGKNTYLLLTPRSMAAAGQAS